MIITDQMKDFKIYKTKAFLPTLENDKKKKSSIIMITPDYSSSKKIMNYPLFINKKRYESYYLDRDVSYYIGSKNLEEIDEQFLYLNETKRSNLSDKDFGIPEDRKYPLDTKKHVQSAIKLFGHAEESKKHKLARRIAVKARYYNIDIPTTTQCYKYLHEAVGDRLEFPKRCPYCKGIHVTIKGCDPTFWCTDCDKPIGSVPEHFSESAVLEESNYIDTFIFDLGGVLIDTNTRYNNLIDIGIDEDDIDKYVDKFYEVINSRQCLSDIDPEATIGLYISKFDTDEEKELAKSAFETIATSHEPYPYSEELLKRLKSEGKKLYYLSNWEETTWDLMDTYGKLDILKYFDDGVVSWKVGYEKPGDDIYTIFKEKFKDIDFSKTIFFDDNPSNVEAARRNGINSIIWNREEGPNIVEFRNSILKDEYNNQKIIESKNNFDTMHVNVKRKTYSIHEDILNSKVPVYFCKDITPENILKIYQVLGKELPGNVAVKLHSGEKGNKNFLGPDLYKPLIDYVDGTVVECNTAYGGSRATTEDHMKTLDAHGWSKHFKVDIMDKDGEVEIPVNNGKVLSTNLVGTHLEDYDSMLVLSHFKGHIMGGYGGALKNISIGVASANGKRIIHRIPIDQDVSSDIEVDQHEFIQAMADAAGSIVDHFNGNMVFINVMKNISVDCDCDANAHPPCMDDIGILASTDPVALDAACLTLIKNSTDPGAKKIIARINEKYGYEIINDASWGNFNFEMIDIDAINDKSYIEESANITKRWGIVTPDGAYNSCCSVKGYEKPMRERSTMIVFNDKGQIYGKMNHDCNEIILPGGGLNENESPMDAAIRETKEEARIYVDNVRYAGELIEYYEQIRDWVRDNVPEKDWWFGYYSHIYVGNYNGTYNGHIDDIDKDNDMLKNGRWWDIDEALPYLIDEYKEIIESEKSRYVTESNNDESYKMYIVSDTFYGDSKQLNPTVPTDKFTKEGLKDQKIERVVFYPSIKQALIAGGDSINQGREMFVHVPIDDNVKFIKPSKNQVIDVDGTGELWVKQPVKIKCIGKIRIGQKGKSIEIDHNGKKYNEYTWNYSWLSSQDKHTVQNEEYLVEKALPQFSNSINTGDKLILFNEDATDSRLKQMLYNSRMKTRKEQLLVYEKVKKDNPWIKYSYPELKRYNSKNLFIDTYYYTQIFFQNNTWTLKKGLDLYTEFMNRLINNPSIKQAGYTKKTIIFPVQDWDFDKSGNLWNFRASINPMALIYQFLFIGNLNGLVKIFEKNDVLFLGNGRYFKINFSNIQSKDCKKYAQKFKTFLIKFAKDEEIDSEDIDTSFDNYDSSEVIQAKIADSIEDSRGVDLTPELSKARNNLNKNNTSKNINKKNQDTTKDNSNISKMELNKPDKDISNNQNNKDALADRIVQVSNISSNLDDAIDNLDTPDIKDMILDLSDNGDKVDISAGRAARMTALDDKFKNTVIKNKTVKEILDDTSDKEEIKTDLNISTPSKEWSEMTYMNFDKKYNVDKYILACFDHFKDVSRPLVVKKIEVTDNSTSEDRVELYRVQLEDYRGKQFTVKLDIPIMEDNRFLLRGNYKSIKTQFFNMPIIKTDLDTCQIISNYMKIFLRRFRTGNGRSLPATAMLIKALSKYTGRNIKVINGDNSKICNKYNLTIDYIDLASVYNSIENENYKFIFNYEQMLKEYDVDESKGLAYGYDKKNKSVLYLHDNSSEMVYSIINYLSEDNKFTEILDSVSRPTICTYSRASIMNSQIPLVIICAYHEGLRTTMDKALITYDIVKNISKEDRHNFQKDWIRFSDGYIVYDVTYESSLLMNGLKECETREHSIAEIDDRNMYLEFLDNYGGRIKADGLDNFYDLFVDPMILESLEYYKLPKDYVSILVYANALLSDNKFIKHTNTSSRKLRRYELIPVYTYKVLADSYAQYANQVKHVANAASFMVKQSAVIDKFLTDSITSEDSIINALRDLETTNEITTKGPSGMNEDRSYSLDKRTYDDSMLNVVAVSTGFAGNVGISRQATLNSSVTSEGYVKPINGDTSKMNDANTLCATEALTPFGSTHDDPMRTAMTFIQTSKHGVRTANSDPLLVTNGSDEALAYLTTNRFAYKAKMKGVVKEVTDNYIIITYDDGTSDFINLSETIEKNSDGGYFVPLKLDINDNIKVGTKVKEGQIIAYDKESFSNSMGESDKLAYNIGTLAKVAIINTDECFEDSGIMSEAMAAKLATRVDYCFPVKLSKDTIIYDIAKVGSHVEAGEEILVWQNPFEDEDTQALMKSFSAEEISDLGKRKLEAGVTGTLKGIKIYRTCEVSELSDSLKKIVKEYEKPLIEMEQKIKEYNISKSVLPAHYKLESTGKMKKSDDIVLIEFFIEYQDTVGVGEAITA